MKRFKSIRQPELAFLDTDRIIRQQVKEEGDVIYGGQSMKKQLGFFGRDSFDWDILSKTPRKSAHKLQKNLDFHAQDDVFYDTPSKHHKGTYKVYYVGKDRKKGTTDDLGIADFTKMRKIKIVKRNGLKYAHLSETIKDKKKSLSDKQFAFRHAKDKEDLDRIRSYRKFNR